LGIAGGVGEPTDVFVVTCVDDRPGTSDAGFSQGVAHASGLVALAHLDRHPDRAHAPWFARIHFTACRGNSSQRAQAHTMVFILALLLSNSNRRLKILIWALVFSGLFQALYGILMTLSGIELIFFYDKKAVGLVTGTYINRNHLAGYLVICLSLGIGLMLGMLSSQETATWRSWIRGWLQVLLSPKLRLRLFLIIMVIALVMTHSRMGNIAFFTALLLTGIAGLVFLRHARRSMTILIISLIIIDILLIGAWFGVDKVMERLEHSFAKTDQVESAQHIQETDIYITQNTVALAEDRGRVNRDMKAYWSDYWLTGSGLGTFRYVFPKYQGPDIRSFYEHAHRDYTEFAVEGGIVGVLLPGFMMLYPLVIAVNTMRRRKNKLMQGVSFGVAMSITALMIHSTVDFNLQIPANALTFMVVLALAMICANMPTENTRSKEAR
jgi:O-antigen ligase